MNKILLNTLKLDIYYPILTTYIFNIMLERWPSLKSMQFKSFIKLLYTWLCRFSSIAATSSAMASLISWVVWHASRIYSLLNIPIGRNQEQHYQVTKELRDVPEMKDNHCKQKPYCFVRLGCCFILLELRANPL